MSLKPNQYKVLAVSALCGVVGITVTLQDSSENNTILTTNSQGEIAQLQTSKSSMGIPKASLDSNIKLALSAPKSTIAKQYNDVEEINATNNIENGHNNHSNQKIADNSGWKNRSSSLFSGITDQNITWL